ncbi:MAG: hypothetical protein OHK0028_08680 [Deltaproteobacteria bacterium]
MYLLAASRCENRVAGAVLAFELLTGLRAGEARNLQWGSVDIDKGTIHLRASMGGVDAFLPLSGAAAGLLQGLPREHGNLYVFPGAKGGRVGVRSLFRYGRALAAQIGLPEDFRPNHGLRRSLASHLASSGEVDLYTIRKLPTHKTPKMTRRYAHLRDESLRRGAEAMGRAFHVMETIARRS